MKAWFNCNLGDAMMAEESLGQIKSFFLAEYEKAKRPKNMAVYFRHESEGRLHCEIKVYFSPAAARIAKAVGATPCNKPASHGLSLLAGSAEC